MRWGGVILALFIVYHVLHFTTGTLYVEAPFNRTDVYANVVNGFRNPIVSLFYILSMVALGFHLYHGVWSMAQTLGWRNGVNNHLWRGFATVMAIVIAGGNISIPLAVMVGIVRP
jgi:succinate dehydrogenase / fumarate reductase cytochrome b subunit